MAMACALAPAETIHKIITAIIFFMVKLRWVADTGGLAVAAG